MYPLDNTTCPTDPQVSVFNITLRRVTVVNGNSPGILLGNASNPTHNITFEDVVHVNSSGFPVGANYLCTAVTGVARGTTSPVPSCFVDETTEAAISLAAAAAAVGEEATAAEGEEATAAEGEEATAGAAA